MTENLYITHVLVDCENVGLSGLSNIVSQTDGTPLSILLFHNDECTWKIKLSELREIGYALSDNRVETIPLHLPEGMTKKQAANALDFYITFHLGRILAQPFSHNCCIVLSMDGDYDPVILHIEELYGKGRCIRLNSYDELAQKLGFEAPARKSVQKTKPKKKAVSSAKDVPKTTISFTKTEEKILNTLKKIAGSKRPKKLSSLKKSIMNNLPAKEKKDEIVEAFVKKLQETGMLALSEDRTQVEKYSL